MSRSRSSSPSRRRRTSGIARLLTGALVLFAVTAATARGAKPPESAARRPLAVRGGVLLLPLKATVDRWPETVELELADGLRLEGRIGWIYPVEPSLNRWWTEQSRGLAVRPVRADDRLDPERPGGPILLARLPRDGSGPIRLGTQQLDPVWLDPPSPLPAGDRPRLEVVPGLPDQPDPISPFAHWRWMLVAERYQQAPPDPARYAEWFGDVGVLLAEHDSQLWQIAIERIARLDVSLAERCRDLLTRVCMDGPQPFASWVADPDQVSGLLSSLLDERASSTATRNAVDVWLQAQRPLLMWLEAEFPDRVRLAMVNRGREPIVARFSWPGRDDVPIAVELHAGVLTPVDLDRPPPRERLQRTTLVEPDVLRIDIDGQVFRLPLAPRTVVARPPGASRELRRPLTLAEVETGALLPDLPDEATQVQLRRREGRWELFFECRRSANPSGATTAWSPAGVDLPLGNEAVVAAIGDPGDAGGSIRLTIPERDGVSVWGGDDQTVEVYRRSFGDRWYARIVLPESWLRDRPGTPTLVGWARTYDAHAGFQVAPGAATPWRAV
ncbi:MAG: hypothetical protein ACYTJ0_16600, partial [Planctomycetota bacterium]